jgi:small GTP-binding protein
MSANRLEIRQGDHVKCVRNGEWHSTTVMEINEDETFILKWHDGEISTSCKDVFLEDQQTFLDRLINSASNLKRANILVAGKTGVGKSTLINSIFRHEVAATGSGQPVTQDIREFKDPEAKLPFSIFDTPGLELSRYKERMLQVSNFVISRKSDSDACKHIHCTWICISEDSCRVETAEQQLCKTLSQHMPVIIVITKSRFLGDFESKVRELLPEAKCVLRVRAMVERIPTPSGHIELPILGLDELVNITTKHIPEGHRTAFVAAQKVVMESKISNAMKCVAAAAVIAFGIGAIPMNFADAVMLVPIHAGMITGITVCFGPCLERGVMSALAATCFAAAVGTLAGRALTRGVLAAIPGAGILIGSMVCGSTASALTTAIGGVYIAILVKFFTDNPDGTPSKEYLSRELSTRLDVLFKNSVDSTRWYDGSAHAYSWFLFRFDFIIARPSDHPASVSSAGTDNDSGRKECLHNEKKNQVQ